MLSQIKIHGNISHERSLLRITMIDPSAAELRECGCDSLEVVAHVRNERSTFLIRFDVEERNSVFLR